VRDGVLPTAFSVENNISVEEFEITGTYAQITTDFSANAPKVSPFKTAGVAIGRKIYTGNVTESYEGPQSVLGDILLNEKDIDEEFFISDDKIKKLDISQRRKKRRAQNIDWSRLSLFRRLYDIP